MTNTKDRTRTSDVDPPEQESREENDRTSIDRLTDFTERILKVRPEEIRDQEPGVQDSS